MAYMKREINIEKAYLYLEKCGKKLTYIGVKNIWEFFALFLQLLY